MARGNDLVNQYRETNSRIVSNGRELLTQSRKFSHACGRCETLYDLCSTSGLVPGKQGNWAAGQNVPNGAGSGCVLVCIGSAESEEVVHPLYAPFFPDL